MWGKNFFVYLLHNKKGAFVVTMHDSQKGVNLSGVECAQKLTSINKNKYKHLKFKIMKNLQIYRLSGETKISSNVKHFIDGITTTKTDLNLSVVKAQLSKAIKLGFPTALSTSRFQIEYNGEVLYTGTVNDLFKPFNKYQQGERIAVAVTKYFDLRASKSTSKDEVKEANADLTEIKKQAIELLGSGNFKFSMEIFGKSARELEEIAEARIVELEKVAEEVK